jgi:drug/metabolite transporter (DMT)-like permease
MSREQKRRLVTGGLVCGSVLGAGMAFQQYGILHSEAGKAGFITALYIVLVPLVGVFFKHRLRIPVLFAALLCTAGLFFLCVTETLTIGLGDVYLLICAACFTAHILVVAHYSPQTDGVRLSCMQFFVASAISAGLAFFFETPAIGDIAAGWGPIVYSAFISCGAGFTLQIIAQRDTAPAVASLLMSLESVFAVLAQWVIMGDLLSGRELLGCLLMFMGIALAQLPQRRRKAVSLS